MYKLVISLALAMSYVFNLQAVELGDTVKVIDNATNVVVLKKDATTIVKAAYKNRNGEKLHYQYEINIEESPAADTDEFPDQWGMDFPFLKIGGERQNDTDGWDGDKFRVERDVTGFRHIYWGWRFNYGSKTNVKNCFELGIRDLIGVSWKRRGAELEIGAGFGFKRMLAQDGFQYEKNGDSVHISAIPTGFKIKNSRLDIWSFQVPVIYNQKICRELSVSLGGIMNFNTYAKSNTSSEMDDTVYKVKYNHLQQNLFSLEAFAAIHICGVGIYGSWNPTPLFKNGYGPELKGFSIGVDLDF